MAIPTIDSSVSSASIVINDPAVAPASSCIQHPHNQQAPIQTLPLLPTSPVAMQQQHLLDSEMSPTPYDDSQMGPGGVPITITTTVGSGPNKRKEVMTLPLPPGALPPRKRAKTKDEKEQRRIERIMRNRQAAHASREKKRRHVEELEKKCVSLTSENEKLHSGFTQIQSQRSLLFEQFKRLASMVESAKASGDLSSINAQSLLDESLAFMKPIDVPVPSPMDLDLSSGNSPAPQSPAPMFSHKDDDLSITPSPKSSGASGAYPASLASSGSSIQSSSSLSSSAAATTLSSISPPATFGTSPTAPLQPTNGTGTSIPNHAALQPTTTVKSAASISAAPSTSTSTKNVATTTTTKTLKKSTGPSTKKSTSTPIKAEPLEPTIKVEPVVAAAPTSTTPNTLPSINPDVTVLPSSTTLSSISNDDINSLSPGLESESGSPISTPSLSSSSSAASSPRSYPLDIMFKTDSDSAAVYPFGLLETRSHHSAEMMCT